MFLITSATFCSQELSSEVGRIPPAFLPVGNKRLYELQIEEIGMKRDFDIFISLPENFEIPDWDRERLQEYNVKILRIPPNLSLGESIVYSLNLIAFLGTIRILYGDTLIRNIDLDKKDAYGVGIPEDEYNWHFIDSEHVLSGYFIFSNSLKLINCILQAHGDFVNALQFYNKEQKLSQIFFKEWYDFGHINTYFKSKAAAKTQRVFNEINIKSSIVEKRSSNLPKMEAEINWYTHIPPELKIHTPNFIDTLKSEENIIIGYRIEYLYLSSLSDLFVFGTMGNKAWSNILNNCFQFLDKCHSYKSDTSKYDHYGLYYQKIIERLKIFAQNEKLRLDQPLRYDGIILPSLPEIVTEIYECISHSANPIDCVIHGDLCFSNMFYDFRSNTIKVIDPRGLNSKNEKAIYGDIRYDIAKLAHSIIGLYDHIIAGHFKAEYKGNDYKIIFPDISPSRLEENFWILVDKHFAKYKNDILPIVIGLFLSMLPLHSDRSDRQYAFLANALRLYCQFKKGNKK